MGGVATAAAADNEPPAANQDSGVAKEAATTSSGRKGRFFANFLNLLGIRRTVTPVRAVAAVQPVVHNVQSPLHIKPVIVLRTGGAPCTVRI